MEFEQIIKRLDFLEKQQRENKEAVTSVRGLLKSFETTVNAVSKQIKAVEKQVSDISPAAKRVDQFETTLSKLRTDITKMVNDGEKARTKSEKDLVKKLDSEISEINKVITQLKVSTNLTELKKQIKDSSGEIQRVVNNLSDLKSRTEDAIQSNNDMQRTLETNDEVRKNDLKRIADLQGEITSVRKRVDENREKTMVQEDALRRVEGRFTELLTSEQERKQAQAAFLDQQSVAQIDRDRAWKEWREKYDVFKQEAESLDTQVEKLDDALRNAKKAQDTYVELNTKLEKRINEVTEMQRLTEDRLRQEWVTFKADDQKRWTGYNLSAEESMRDIRKDIEKSEERLTALSEVAQVVQDQLHQTTDTTEKQLQETMNVIHESLTSYQRIMGHGKKPAKK